MCQGRQQTTRRNRQVRPFFHKYRPTRVSSSTLLLLAEFFRILSSTRQSWYLYSFLVPFSFIIASMQITLSSEKENCITRFLPHWNKLFDHFFSSFFPQRKKPNRSSCYSFISMDVRARIFLSLTTDRSQKENFPPRKLSWSRWYKELWKKKEGGDAAFYITNLLLCFR